MSEPYYDPMEREEEITKEEFEAMSKIEWWGYLHQNGTIQVKRWFGDHKDYTEVCEGNEFVQRVVSPFEASSREDAIEIIRQRIARGVEGRNEP